MSCSPGEMITVVPGRTNPLDAGQQDLYTGIITEKGTNYIKVAFDPELAPEAEEGPFR